MKKLLVAMDEAEWQRYRDWLTVRLSRMLPADAEVVFILAAGEGDREVRHATYNGDVQRAIFLLRYMATRLEQELIESN